MWQKLSWPQSASQIQSNAESVTGQISTSVSESVERLKPLTGDAAYSRHDLSTDAQSLLNLRNELNQLLVIGTIITVTPYQFQVGNRINHGWYLNPRTAIDILVQKLRDASDINRPDGQLHVVGIMTTAPNLGRFVSELQTITEVLPLPQWCQVKRQSESLLSNETDKFFEPAAIVQPRFKPGYLLNTNPMHDYFRQQGTQIAMLESLASDQTHVIGKLAVLAAKRKNKMAQVSASINAMKTLKGSLWSFAISGSLNSVASQLSNSNIPNNHQYTIASLIISDSPLKFWEELCSL